MFLTIKEKSVPSGLIITASMKIKVFFSAHYLYYFSFMLYIMSLLTPQSLYVSFEVKHFGTCEVKYHMIKVAHFYM